MIRAILNSTAWTASFGKPKAVDPEASAALKDLDALAARRDDLSEICRATAEIIHAIYCDLIVDKTTMTLDADALLEGWKNGRPAFETIPPKFDPAKARDRAIRICRATSNAPMAVKLREATESGRIDFQQLATEWILNGGTGSLEFPEEFLTSVLRLIVLPEWSTQSTRYLECFEPDLWNRIDCPCCGSPPLIGEERGLERSRYLRCGFCASERRVGRTSCPACGETDAHRIRYRFVEDDRDKMRLLVCDACGGRLRIVSSLGRLSAPRLLAAELETAHLEWLGDELPSPVSGDFDD